MFRLADRRIWKLWGAGLPRTAKSILGCPFAWKVQAVCRPGRLLGGVAEMCGVKTGAEKAAQTELNHTLCCLELPLCHPDPYVINLVAPAIAGVEVVTADICHGNPAPAKQHDNVTRTWR